MGNLQNPCRDRSAEDASARILAQNQRAENLSNERRQSMCSAGRDVRVQRSQFAGFASRSANGDIPDFLFGQQSNPGE